MEEQDRRDSEEGPRQPTPSRERRRDLLRELQARVYAYEQQGVEVSQEIQRAARQVNERARQMEAENKALRGLLQTMGVAEAQVNDYLCQTLPTGAVVPHESHDSLVHTVITNGRPILPSVSTLLNRERPPSPVVDPALSLLNAQPNMSIFEHRNPLDQSFLSRNGYRPVSARELRAPDSAVASRPDNIDACCDPGTETSCEEAAAILADMQGHGNPSRAREALGCAGSSPCRVKNIKIFELLDQATDGSTGL